MFFANVPFESKEAIWNYLFMYTFRNQCILSTIISCLNLLQTIVFFLNYKICKEMHLQVKDFEG